MHYLLAITLFLLSFSPKLSILTILPLFVWSIIRFIKNPKHYYSLIGLKELIFFLFYLLHCIGLAHTKNIDNAFFDLEIKLSLIVLPIISICLPLIDNKSLKVSFKAYVIGCGLGVIVGAINAISLYFEHNSTDYLYSSYFSFFIPSNYYGIYLLTGILMILFLIKDTTKKSSTYIYLLLILLLTTGLILTTSRAAFLSGVLLLIIYILRNAINDYSTRKLLLSVGILILIFSTLYYAPLTPIKRFSNIITELRVNNENTTNKSASLRFHIWKSSWDVIKGNWIIGVGTGDVKAELKRKYQEKNIIQAKERSYNAHNQFFQSWISIGISGLLCLVSIFLLVFYQSYIRSNIWLFIFLFPWFIFMLTESILERQYGVILFSLLYFYIFNFFIPKKEKGT